MKQVYNRFDPSKRWKSIDFVGGRRIQTAELNELQAMSLFRDKQIGDVIFGAGHIIDGGQLYISADKTLLRISPARVYLDGIIHDLPETTLTISGAGEESIGLRVETRSLTYEDDPTLYDPAVGFSNYGMPGGQRTIIEPAWTLNDEAATPMFRLVDGELVTAKLPPELEGFTPVFARRTYDTNGSFLVSGMDGYIEPKDAENVTLVVDAGRAYVLGYQIDKLVPIRVSIPKALDTRMVVNETKTYLAGTSYYPLNTKPVKAIRQVTATVERTDTITRGNVAGTSDMLPKTPVVDIVSVRAGSTEYKKSVDFQLSGDTVDWSLAGAEPAGGTSYTVTYRYTKVMVEGTDVELENDGIKWLSGDKPVVGTTFQTTYEFYLARKDVYYLTFEGEVKVIHGQSDISPYPPSSPPDVLELGEIYLPPNSNAVVVTNRKPKRLTMLELRSLLDRLERAEYNQAIADLDRQAQISDPTLLKKGIFTDNFTNFERADVTHPLFDAMLNPREKVVQLPLEQTFVELQVEQQASTVRFHERLVTLPYKEEVLIDQTYATEAMNVNPYQVFGNLATIRLTPSHDTWVEESIVTKKVWGWWADWRTTGTTRTETKMILDENVPYIRQREITVSGEGFEPFSDNIKGTFDGIPVHLVPLNGTLAGTLPNTIRADKNGRFTCKFMIPPNVRTGTREVYLWNEV
ncbi:DUF4815 domain-containing protein [Brevibacillus borstelensis]|uniref:DUF4815 domain-containing protein n=1 Tax=Brevibacillus borstelensis TaxID=45462 RepID=UPI00116E3AEA|nr:DUF4815 domain-containing protein [Brevibacillus borstelensis]MED1883074.1 DUF4815 domain-containing protein [Brevibacillus borstelensis]GED54920.1 hypothetical protein BBO01nite_41610 [Brevibacillus borstelensis]